MVVYKIVSKLQTNRISQLHGDLYAKMIMIKEEYASYKRNHNYIDFDDMINISSNCYMKIHYYGKKYMSSLNI
jgi:superfamily I DNA/RNA helicase